MAVTKIRDAQAVQSIDLTSEVANALPVANGGTGVGTLTGIVKASGTSNFTAVTAPTGAIVGTSDTQTLTAKTLTDPKINNVLGSNNHAVIGIGDNASSVNNWYFYNANAGGVIGAQAVGSDTDIDMQLQTKGAGRLKFYQNSGDAGIIVGGTATDIAFDITCKGGGRLTESGVEIVDVTHPVTLTNKRVTPRITTINAPGATPTIATDTYDQINYTGLAAAITSMTTNLTGTPTDGQKLMLRFKDNGTARAITWGASFVSSGVATLLATTVISKTHLVGLLYDSAVAKWIAIAVDATGY